MAKKCDATKLVPGEFLYEVTYYKVLSVDDKDVHVIDNTGNKLLISRDVVERLDYSTTQFTSEVKMTRSELAQKIEGLGHAAFRVKFRKQVAPNDLADALDGKDITTQAKRRKIVKELMEGEERVMHAKLVRSDEFDAAMEMGRYRVYDLTELDKHQDEKRAIRLIDTRTVSELVVDGIRYYVV